MLDPQMTIQRDKWLILVVRLGDCLQSPSGHPLGVPRAHFCEFPPIIPLRFFGCVHTLATSWTALSLLIEKVYKCVTKMMINSHFSTWTSNNFFTLAWQIGSIPCHTDPSAGQSSHLINTLVD